MSLPVVDVVAAVIWNQHFDEVLIAKRPVGKHKAGFWEFPGGKVEALEDPLAGLRRELNEELSLHFSGATFLVQTDFPYPEKTVSIKFYHVFSIEPDFKANEGQVLAWVKVEQLTNFVFPEANQHVLDLLVAGEKPSYSSDHCSEGSL